MTTRPVSNSELELIEAAKDTIRARFDPVYERHTVAASVRTQTGRIISAVNVFANCGYGPCAEAVVIGLAATLGDTNLHQVVAVGAPDRQFPILSPCGNCRQLLMEYFPNIEVIVHVGTDIVVTNIQELLPFNYKSEL